MQLTPYLHFKGNCEEALNAYQQIFNGNIEGLNRYDSAPMPVPDDHKQKVLHALFRFGDNTIMASDAFPGHPLQQGDSVMLSVGLKDETATREIFNKLAEGGKVTMPLEKQFWGALFGQVTDRFGVHWMLNCE